MTEAARPAPPRPLEVDALRFLTIVHQLGRPIPPFSQALVNESLLLGYDHLLRHPTTLAYLLIDQHALRPDLRDKRAAMARRARALIAALPGPAPTGKSRFAGLGPRFAPFAPVAPWHRIDDVLALLTSQLLLKVVVRSAQPPELILGILPAGLELLDRRFYAAGASAAPLLQGCATIAEFLPPCTGLELENLLAAVGERLDRFRRDEHVPAERDLLPGLFERVFRERL